MGSMMKRVYYREPKIMICGKYGKLLTADELYKIKCEMKDLYGRELSSIQIEYKNKTKGPMISRTLDHPALYFEGGNFSKYSTIFYSDECGGSRKAYLVRFNGKNAIVDEIEDLIQTDGKVYAFEERKEEA